MKRPRMLVGLVVLGIGLLAQSAEARQGPSPPRRLGHEVVDAPFTVKSIDKVNRTIRVARTDGSQTILEISPGAVGFDVLKRGDAVEIDYYRSSVLAFEPTGVEHDPGEMGWQKPLDPTIKTGREITTAARISSIDAQGGTAQVLTWDGRPETLFVADPTFRKRLASFKPGAHVVVTFTEPVAVHVNRMARPLLP